VTFGTGTERQSISGYRGPIQRGGLRPRRVASSRSASTTGSKVRTTREDGPTDPAALPAGLRDGTVRLADLDRTDADHMNAVAHVAARLTTRMPATPPAGVRRGPAP